MSLCEQCDHHSTCSRSGLPDHLIRNILFMTTSIESPTDMLYLVEALYGQEFRDLAIDQETALRILYPQALICPYLTA